MTALFHTFLTRERRRGRVEAIGGLDTIQERKPTREGRRPKRREKRKKREGRRKSGNGTGDRRLKKGEGKREIK